jgi:rRNA maturation endonuclease Nob1
MEEEWESSRRGRCPECGSEDVKKVVYGYPDDPENWPPDLIGGGCLPKFDAPTRICGDCGHAWGRPRRWSGSA